MKYDVVALGELLIDFTIDGKSNQGNNTYEANPGGAPCNVLAMLNKMNKKTAFIGKVGNDAFGQILKNKYNIKIILLTAGSKGSTAYYKDLVVKQEAYLQSNTIDTTGAGDTFCGSCLGYIIENDIDNLNEEKIKDMISFASAAASIVTTKKGAICSMPEIEEVEKLRKKYE